MTIEACWEEVMDSDFACPVYGRCGLKTSRFAHILKEGSPGDALLDENLEKVVFAPVSPGARGYGSLMRAIRYVEAEHNIVWRRIRLEGRIVCLDPQARLGVVRGGLASVGRRSRRVHGIALGTDRSGVSTAESKELGALAIQLALVGKVATPRKTRFLAARSDENQERVMEHLLKS